MNVILEIISNWHPIGQGLFFLILLSLIFVFLHRAMFFLTVLIRGWPPEHVTDTMKFLSTGDIEELRE